MSTQSKNTFRLFKDAARRVGAIVQAMDASPFEMIDDRLQRLEVRLAALESKRASPATSDLAGDVRRPN